MLKTETAPSSPKDTAAPHLQPTHEAIALRAHQIFLDRGCEHGHDVDDWLQAEREVRTNGLVRKLRSLS
ncbi:MAG TPA: DUF2934 domain-containing protein [Candidatus Acidoferrales bacterium]|nr:DUF2934 domain-containing protein [Candidatus Acidoferrales bacterium]